MLTPNAALVSYISHQQLYSELSQTDKSERLYSSIFRRWRWNELCLMCIQSLHTVKQLYRQLLVDIAGWNATSSCHLWELCLVLGCTFEEVYSDLKIKWNIRQIECISSIIEKCWQLRQVLLSSKPSSKLPTWWIWLPWIWTRTLSLDPGMCCNTELAWTLCCKAVATAAGSKLYTSRFFIRVTYKQHINSIAVITIN